MVPLNVISDIVVLIFVLAVALHGRQVEWMARLDFLWQLQAREEKMDMEALQSSNKRILFNLLPAHVATHFLDNQFRSNLVGRKTSYHPTFLKLSLEKRLLLTSAAFFALS